MVAPAHASDIDEFLLVLEPVEVKPRVEPDAQTIADVLNGRDASRNALVGFRFLPEKRLRPRRKADGYVMGCWDRPLDQAVGLMNEWLTRSRGDMPADQR